MNYEIDKHISWGERYLTNGAFSVFIGPLMIAKAIVYLADRLFEIWTAWKRFKE